MWSSRKMLVRGLRKRLLMLRSGRWWLRRRRSGCWMRWKRLSYAGSAERLGRLLDLLKRMRIPCVIRRFGSK